MGVELEEARLLPKKHNNQGRTFVLSILVCALLSTALWLVGNHAPIYSKNVKLTILDFAFILLLYVIMSSIFYMLCYFKRSDDDDAPP